jgi:hypothetical protein
MYMTRSAYGSPRMLRPHRRAMLLRVPFDDAAQTFAASNVTVVKSAHVIT